MRRLARNIFTKAMHAAAQMWWAVRQIFGDAAYENYLRSFTPRGESVSGTTPVGASSAPLSPAEFYLDSVRRKYSRISRCC
jgi:hypothetical protein